jgi:hypothetical protein
MHLTACKANLKGGHRYWLSVVANEEGGGYTVWDGKSGPCRTAIWLLGKILAARSDIVQPGRPSSPAMSVGAGPDLIFAVKGKDAVE